MTNYKELSKNIFLFFVFGILYYFIEIWFRGYSYPTMIFIGGLAGCVIGASNEYNEWDESLILHGLHCAVYVLMIELVSGIICNRWLGMHLWDYSSVPGNILGQICLPFFFAWWALGIVGTVLDDILRHVLFKEPIQKYRLI